MAKDLSLNDLTQSLKKLKSFFNKHISILFVISALSALVYSVVSVNLILSTPSDAEYMAQKESETTSTQFDKKTIEKIESLGNRQNTAEPVLPSGRINPFSD